MTTPPSDSLPPATAGVRLEPERAAELVGRLERNVARVVLGKRDVIRSVVVGLLSQGHILLEDVPVDAPLCVVVGNESRGLSPAAKAAMRSFRIPMVGLSQSLNLSVSAAIALFDVTRRRRALLRRSGDLDPTAAARLRAYAYARTVDPRMLAGLFGGESGGRPARSEP